MKKDIEDLKVKINKLVNYDSFPSIVAAKTELNSAIIKQKVSPNSKLPDEVCLLHPTI